jgi:hypothetical protein
MFGLSYLKLGIIAAVGLSIITLAICFKVQTARLHTAQERLKAAESMLASVTDANASCVVTVDAQGKALKKWAALGVTETEVAGWRDQMQRHKQHADELRAENNMLRSKDRALPECVALLKISLQSRCPNVAAGLRKLAGGNQNGDSRGANSGLQATAR